MSKIIQAVAVALVLALIGERAYELYLWKKYTDERAHYAEASAVYLFSDTGAKKDGKPLTRAALLDLLLTEALTRAVPSPSSAPPGASR